MKMYTKFKAAFMAASSLKCFWIMGAIVGQLIDVFFVTFFKSGIPVIRWNHPGVCFKQYNSYWGICILTIKSAGQWNETGKFGLNVITKNSDAICLA